MGMVELKSLVGRRLDFYGVDNTVFCIRTAGEPGDRIAFEVLEDEDDGYRSMLKEVKQVSLKGHIFFRNPIARVRLEEDETVEGYRLVDVKDGHIWLRFGTDYSDDYYPNFVFDYQPRGSR